MIKNVLFVWLSIIVISVATNPVPQLLPAQQYPVFQQNTRNNPNYQPAESQNNPCPQHITVQNQAPMRQLNFDGSINQLLISKILGNPCLQKILDPNTKLINQNGLEIQRQPNTGAAPNVVNNYFIVPPEFFNLNDTNPIRKTKNGHKRRKVHLDRKAHDTTTKKDIKEIEDLTVLDNLKINNRQKNGRFKKGERRNQNKKSASIIAKNDELDVNQDKKERKVKKTKRRRKQEQLTRKESTVSTPSFSGEIQEDNLDENAIVPPDIKNEKRKRPRKQPKVANEESLTLGISDTNAQDSVASQNKQLTSDLITKNPTTPSKIIEEKYVDTIDSENESHLRNIETPVENEETKDFKQNGHDTENYKDTRKTRNPKSDKTKKESSHKITPIPDDILRNFFPYMYMGNNFYSNGMYPFTFEQLYQHDFNRNNRRNKKSRTRKNNNKRNKKGSLPNVVEVKLKPTKQNVTTTANPVNVESAEEIQSDFTSTESTTQVSESVSDIPLEKLSEVKQQEELKNESKLEIPEKGSVVTKSNLEMPPTVIEDLHEFITPDLGREDIVPTIHTNGIINDYYPIFYDDSYYNNDESYYLTDLEDDRHFYTTDRGHEELFNRNRRKYDTDENYRRPNHDIRDRINFRRGKYRERDRIKEIEDDDENSIRRPFTHDKITEQEKTSSKTEKYNEVHFQTPPSLENPDFRTKKIDKEISKFNINSYELLEPIYTDLTEKVSDYKTYSDIKPAQFGRLINVASDVNKDNVVPTNSKPRNDRVETMFAKTRVVKYGVANEKSGENTSMSTLEDDDDDDTYHSDGHTTFVVAKSLGHIDDYHW